MAIKDLGGLDPIPRADGVRVGLNLVVGDLKQALGKVPQCITPRINRVAYPGSDFDQPRNDLYVTFVSGDFLASLKSPRVKLYVRSWNPKTQELKAQPAIWRGTGQEKPSEEYQCYVILRCDKPTWNNTVKIQIPAAQYPNCHLFFTISEAKDGEESKFSNDVRVRSDVVRQKRTRKLRWWRTWAWPMQKVRSLPTTHTPWRASNLQRVSIQKRSLRFTFHVRVHYPLIKCILTLASQPKTRSLREKKHSKSEHNSFPIRFLRMVWLALRLNSLTHSTGWLYKLITWSNMDPAVLPEVMNRITFVDAYEISRVSCRYLFPKFTN